MFRDEHAALQKAGIRVVGVSPQDRHSHARFRAQHDLPFPLLCDPEKTTIRAYGATGGLGIVIRRVTYLISSPDARIVDVVRADVRIGRHEDLVQRVLRG